MGRPKGFTREEVLVKAIPVFWEKGFAETTLQDLEQATGVNKSGLYAEFKDKEDLFFESLRYYLQTRGGDEILSAEPKGWSNIQRFLEIGQTCYTGRRGCFSINSLRDIVMLPPEGQKIVEANNALLKRLLISNIKTEAPHLSNAGLLADMILTFFAGLCIEQNLAPSTSTTRASATQRKIASFMSFLTEAQ